MLQGIDAIFRSDEATGERCGSSEADTDKNEFVTGPYAVVDERERGVSELFAFTFPMLF